jgi:hypothetical protein
MGNVDGTRVVIRKIDRIDYILSGLCEYWDITLDELFHYARTPFKVNRKRIAMLLLYDVADCSFKDVVSAMNYSSTNVGTIYNHLVHIRAAIDPDTNGNTELKIEYSRILKHLNL